MLKTKIKATAVTNLTDARYFAAMGVEWLGFQLEAGSENHMAPAAARAIKEWVDGVKIVGEFSFTPPEEMLEMAALIGLDAVQVGMFATPEDLSKMTDTIIIKEVVVSGEMTEGQLWEHLEAFSPFCDLFLLDFEKAGIVWEGLPFQKSFLREICQRWHVMLRMDFSSENIDLILEEIQPYGVSVSGGVEERVGVKSFDELDDFFEKLELAA